MQYLSTRGGDKDRSFEDVLLAGLAPDGGLYVPEEWPQFPKGEWRGLRNLSWGGVAAMVMKPFVGDFLTGQELHALVEDAQSTFHHAATTPLKQLDDALFLLELFHGPTLAFKDVAMQILARMMDIALMRRGQHVTIIGATSGDTGSAAIEAFRHSKRVNIFILHPHERVSPIQRRQMTTVDAPNVHNIAIEGDFDDCQALVKAMFNDAPFRERMNLAGVNSINWARILAQVIYYATSALALGAPDRALCYVVPTGNFGDIFAGYVARQMGLPIDRLVVATNVNDILHRALTAGEYRVQGRVTPTTSPSMDIQVSSNDAPFRERMNLAGVNSINWARILAQVIYYATSALALGAPDRALCYVVPTGNFGDIFAGYVARQMGLPIDRLVVATNVNDILHRALTAGEYRVQGRVTPTTSPSMDIQVSSNFERLLFDALERDPARLRALMGQLAQSGGFSIPDDARAYIRQLFASGRADEDSVRATIRDTFEKTGEIVDPHTAVGLAVAREHIAPAHMVVSLATAHPAKFPEAVEAATGVRPALPAHLADIMEAEERFSVLPADLQKVEEFISANVQQA